jgi:hypothetical protein
MHVLRLCACPGRPGWPPRWRGRPRRHRRRRVRQQHLPAAAPASSDHAPAFALARRSGGAHSSRMPRLVLQLCRGPGGVHWPFRCARRPAPRRRTAARRRPARWPGTARPCMRCPGEARLTLPGLRTATSSPQAQQEAGAAAVDARRGVGMHGTARLRRAAHAAPGCRQLAGRSRSSTSAPAMLNGRHALQALPGGHPVDLEHLQRLRGRRGQDVDAGVVHLPSAARRLQRQRGPAPVHRAWPARSVPPAPRCAPSAR